MAANAAAGHARRPATRRDRIRFIPDGESNRRAARGAAEPFRCRAPLSSGGRQRGAPGCQIPGAPPPGIAATLPRGGDPISRQLIIYLARHGETDWNLQNRWQGHTDVPLNDAGRAQAAELAERLRARDLSRVYASDLRRARETAETVAALLGVPLSGTDARLRERSFGVFEGLTREECEARHPDHWRRYRQDSANLPPGAEAVDDVLRRMRGALQELALAGEGPALVVGHGSAIRVLVSAVTGVACAPLRNGAAFRLLLRDGDLAAPGARFVEASPLA